MRDSAIGFGWISLVLSDSLGDGACVEEGSSDIRCNVGVLKPLAHIHPKVNCVMAANRPGKD